MYNNNMYNNQPPYGNYYLPIYNQPQQNVGSQYIVKNVNNFEEAKSINIDFYNTHIFTDFNNSSIYLRKINNNGLEEFYTFKLVENPPDKMAVLEQRLINIERMLIGGNGNNESNDTSVIQANVGENTTTKPSNVSKGTANVARQNTRGDKTNGD